MSDQLDIGLTASQLKVIFPYHIVIDSNLIIAQIGNQLQNVTSCNGISLIGRHFCDVFTNMNVDVVDWKSLHCYRNNSINLQLRFDKDGSTDQSQKLPLSGMVLFTNSAPELMTVATEDTTMIGSNTISDEYTSSESDENDLVLVKQPPSPSIDDYAILLLSLNYESLEDLKRDGHDPSVCFSPLSFQREYLIKGKICAFHASSILKWLHSFLPSFLVCICISMCCLDEQLQMEMEETRRLAHCLEILEHEKNHTIAALETRLSTEEERMFLHAVTLGLIEQVASSVHKVNLAAIVDPVRYCSC